MKERFRLIWSPMNGLWMCVKIEQRLQRLLYYRHGGFGLTFPNGVAEGRDYCWFKP